MIKNDTVLKNTDFQAGGSSEYHLNDAIYSVNRIFDRNKTVKEILFQIITSNYHLISNC